MGSSGNGIHIIDDGDRGAIFNELQTVDGRAGGSTTALYQEVSRNDNVNQSPWQFNSITTDPDEFYMKYWMKLDNTSLRTNNSWRAIWEFKTDNWYISGSREGFRLIVFAIRDFEGNEYWELDGDNDPSHPFWEVRSEVTSIPRDTWFKFEIYFKFRSDETGHAWVKINDEIVTERRGFTNAFNDTMGFFITSQIYGNTTPMHQWVDDVEIWDGIPL